MHRKIRVALIGAGSIFNAHARALLKASDRCEVVAVVKQHPDNAREVRELLGDVRVEQDYRQVLHEVDAVIILLPHDLHLQATLDAARAGKHVLVEKVMARNVYECDRMLEACRNAGVTLTVCHDRRYHPGWMALKRVIDSGVLGEVYHWRLEHNQYLNLPEGHWIRSAAQIGGGAIMSCLTHQIDALRWYAGEVDQVTCMTRVIPARMEGESIGVILARLKSGVLAQLSINWATRMANNLWGEINHVTAQKGEAYYLKGEVFLLLHDNPAKYADFFAGSPPASGAFGKVKQNVEWSGHEGCVEQWLRMLRNEPADLSTTGDDSRRTVEVAEAAGLANASGRVVTLPIAPRAWTQ